MRKITSGLILILALFIGFTANAQPLPPTTPSGNSVPSENIVIILSLALAGLGIIKLWEQKDT